MKYELKRFNRKMKLAKYQTKYYRVYRQVMHSTIQSICETENCNQEKTFWLAFIQKNTQMKMHFYLRFKSWCLYFDYYCRIQWIHQSIAEKTISLEDREAIDYISNEASFFCQHICTDCKIQKILYYQMISYSHYLP